MVFLTSNSWAKAVLLLDPLCSWDCRLVPSYESEKFLKFISKKSLVADVTVDVGLRLCLQNLVNHFQANILCGRIASG